MDTNTVLIVLAGTSAVFTLARVVPNPILRKNSPWIYTSIVLLAILVVALILIPDYAGYVAGAFWLVLFLVPVFGYQLLRRLVIQQRYISALRLAQILRVLQPFPGSSGVSGLMLTYRVMAMAQRGDLAQVASLVAEQANDLSPMARLAKLQVYRIQGDWAGLLNYVVNEKIPLDASVLNLVIRALGETGHLDRMLALFEGNLTLLRQSRSLEQAAMFIFAFSGQKQSLNRLLDGPMYLLSQDYKLFWSATADMAADNRTAAEDTFRKLLENDHPDNALVVGAARQRLTNGVPLAAPQITPEVQQSLARVEQILAQERRYAVQPSGRSVTPYFTLIMIALNVAVFIVETVNGGNTNVETFYKMKALWVPDIAQGDWIRLIAPMFLHDGLTHILLNMVALYVIGPYVEFALGFWKTAIVYFGAGVGASILFYFLVQAGIVPNDISLGASGAIMGLLGAMGAIMYRGWRREKTSVARERLVNVIVIVVLQVIIDASGITQSSLSAHLGGAVLGFIIASLMPHHQQQVKPARVGAQ